MNDIKLEDRPRVIRRHSLPDINANSKNSFICSKFVLKDNERFTDIKIDLVEDYLKNRTLSIDDEIVDEF